jgi:GH18 family chitinase
MIAIDEKTYTMTMVMLGMLIAVLFVAPTAAMSAPQRIVGYYSSWSVYARNYQVADIPAGKLTHVNYAFANISDTGECVLFDPVADVQTPYPGDGGGPVRGNFRQLQILKSQYPQLRTLLSIGGWTLSARFSDVALTATSRQQFAQSCVQLMLQFGFDGLDVDWEYPVSGGLDTNNTVRPQDKQNYTLLLAAMRTELNAQAAVDGRPYLLTAAVGAAPWLYGNLELNKIPAYLDWLSIMAYDLHGGWSPLTNFHSALFAPTDAPPAAADGLSGAAAVQAYEVAGVPAAKILLGMPFYGRGWKAVGSTNNGLFQPHGGLPPGTYEDGVFDYRDLQSNYVPHYARYWHAQAEAPWLYDPTAQIMISYEDPASIAAKTAYVGAQRLGGVMFWELSVDDAQHSLVDAVAAGLRSNCPVAPPTGCDGPGKSVLTIGTGARSKLGWIFARGNTARLPADFGDPTASTLYALCLYDTGARIGETRIAPGPGWRATASGFRYSALDRSAKVLLKAGVTGKPKVQVNLKGGSTLAGIQTPVSTPVSLTAALVNDDTGTCWSATYTSAKTNVLGSFRARTP